MKPFNRHTLAIAIGVSLGTAGSLAAAEVDSNDPFKLKQGSSNRCYWLDRSVSDEGLCGEKMRPNLDVLKEEALAGNSFAAFRLGQLYSSGTWGVERNPAESIKWYRVAAEGGQFQAQLKMAVAYEFGRGVDANLAEAIRWYEQATEQGLYPHLEDKLARLKKEAATTGQ